MENLPPVKPGQITTLNGVKYIYAKVLETQPAKWYEYDEYQGIVNRQREESTGDELSDRINKRLMAHFANTNPSTAE